MDPTSSQNRRTDTERSGLPENAITDREEIRHLLAGNFGTIEVYFTDEYLRRNFASNPYCVKDSQYRIIGYDYTFDVGPVDEDASDRDVPCNLEDIKAIVPL